MIINTMHSPIYQANTGMFLSVIFKYNHGKGIKSLVEVLLLIGFAFFLEMHQQRSRENVIISGDLGTASQWYLPECSAETSF